MSRISNITTALAAVLLTAPAFAYDIQTPGNDTKLSVYGYVYALGQYYIDSVQTGTSSIGPGSDGTGETGVIQFNVKPSRFGVASTTPNATFGDITTKIEYDLNSSVPSKANLTTGKLSSSPTTNFHFRHAFATVGNLTFGHTFSLWNDGDAAPDEIDWAGPVGGPCWDTPRRPLVKYTFPIDKQNSLAVSVEQTSGNTDGEGSANSSYTSGAKTPNFLAAYTYADSWGHVAGRVLMQNHAYYQTTTAGVKGKDYSKYGAAFMLSGDVKFGKDDLVATVYNGDAVGDYGYGGQASSYDVASNSFTFYKNLGFTVGYTHVFTDSFRANLIASGVIFKSDDSTTATVAATNGLNGTFIKSQYNYVANVFWTLNPKTQVGIEYFYETQKTFGSTPTILQNNGSLKNSLDSSKIEVVLQAKF